MKEDRPYLIQFPVHGRKEIGYLTVTEYAEYIPFPIVRVFWTYATPSGITRGRHAHLKTKMVLMALSGRIYLELENTSGDKYNFELANPNQGILIPPLHWHTMRYSEEALQLVIASTPFDEQDYIRSYDDFKKL